MKIPEGNFAVLHAHYDMALKHYEFKIQKLEQEVLRLKNLLSETERVSKHNIRRVNTLKRQRNALLDALDVKDELLDSLGYIAD